MRLVHDSEEWRGVQGYEGLYEVSNLGAVRGLDRCVEGRWGNLVVHGRVLKPQKDRNGYLYVELNRGGSGVKKKIHRLVALAYLTNHNGAPQVNHLSGDKLDNSHTNLEWCTSQENIRHAISTGLRGGGELAGNSKLTLEDVHWIRYNHKKV